MSSRSRSVDVIAVTPAGPPGTHPTTTPAHGTSHQESGTRPQEAAGRPSRCPPSSRSTTAEDEPPGPCSSRPRFPGGDRHHPARSRRAHAPIKPVTTPRSPTSPGAPPDGGDAAHGPRSATSSTRSWKPPRGSDGPATCRRIRAVCRAPVTARCEGQNSKAAPLKHVEERVHGHRASRSTRPSTRACCFGRRHRPWTSSPSTPRRGHGQDDKAKCGPSWQTCSTRAEYTPHDDRLVLQPDSPRASRLDRSRQLFTGDPACR